MTMMMTFCFGTAMGCSLFEKTSPEEQADLVPPSKLVGASAEDLAPAIRLIGSLQARMQLDLAADPEGSLEAVVGELASSTWTTRLFAGEQLTYLVPQLAEAGYQLDLSATRSELTDFELSPDGILSLSYTAELVVLAEPGSEARSVSVILPGNPWRLQARVGHRCLSEGHRDAAAERYAFYFEPGRDGCEAAMISVDVNRDAHDLAFSIAPQPEPLWPEYDRLAEDRLVEAVVVAGAITPTWESGQADPTKRDLFALIQNLEATGFVALPVEPESHVVTLERKISIGMEEDVEIFFEQHVTVIGPEALVRGEERSEAVQAILERAEILLLGSEDAADAVLSVLSTPDREMEPGYQIFVIDGSWRYADQSLEIFSGRSTLEDPTGSAEVDVLTNVSPAVVVGRGARLQILLLNLFKGAEVGGIENDRYFSWDRIVATANLRAREASGQASKSHAIFGATGLDGNRFAPVAE